MPPDKFPLCPHCLKEIKGVLWLTQKINATQVIRVFFCPHDECRKVLSVHLDTEI